MRRGHRKMHLVIWCLLGPTIALVVALAMANRQPDRIVDRLPAMEVSP